MNRLVECGVCWHDFFGQHVETDRRVPTISEQRDGRCRDCVKCNPPESAPVKERDRELVHG